jgi:mono/diheme cytochrome c family protein
MNTKKILSALVLCFLSVSVLLAQDWNVPASAKKKTNPYDANQKNISTGKKVYNLNCKSCHGDPGMNNMLPLAPVLPSDLGSQAFLVQSDGEIFYKINKGKGAMPNFEKTLTTEDKWKVISFLRSFDKNKKAKPKVADVQNPKVDNVKLEIQIDEKEQIVLAQLSGTTKKGKRVGLQGIELSFLAKRSFGYLDVSGEDAYTNEEGKVKLQFPKDLPGDREGQIELLTKITDDAIYGEIQEKRIAHLGTATHPKNPLDERSMWGTRAKAPWWIVLAYVGGVLAIWSVILLVVYRLFKLPKLAKED